MRWCLLVLFALATGCSASIGAEPDIQTEPATAPDPTASKDAKTAPKAATSTPTNATTSTPTPVSDNDSVDATTTDPTPTPTPTPAPTPTPTPAPTPLTSVALSWNRVSATAQYSFDVQPKGGAWVAPCVSVDQLDRQLALTFAGACSSAGSNIALVNIQAFRVCSAENGDWANAHCTAASWDGSTAKVTIALD